MPYSISSRVAFVLVIAVSYGVTSAAWSQPSSEATTVVARVNGEAIYVIDVEQQLAQALRNREVRPDALRLLQAQATEQLIGRQLILQMLAEKKLAANDKEIEVEVERIRKQLAVTGGTLDEHLQKKNLDLPALRRALRWQLSWQRYLDHYLSDENLQKFYAQHRRHFDGTEVRVAHILWKIDVDDIEALASTKQRAQAVRDQINKSQLSFDAAAAEYSDAPTAQSGGQIGFITRHDSMPEPFAKAAFALDKGEVSPPVTTPFGVHLIQCLEVKPGQRPWHDVRESVKLSATEFLFDWIVSQRRGKAEVEYTGALPYFKPGTREIVR